MLARLERLAREDPLAIAGDFLGAFSLIVILVASLHFAAPL